MKRTERRHLKQNELARTVAGAREFIESHSRQIGLTLVILALVAVAALVVTMVRQRSSVEADRMLAEAMVALNARVVPPTDPASGELPAAATLGATDTFTTEAAKLEAALPKLQAAADAHPDTQAGVVARYHLAGALASLGRNEEAATQFSTVIDRATPGSVYARMARLGRANAQVRAGQLDAGIESWKQLAADADAQLPADAILMELARAYVARGSVDDARKTFTELVDEHPSSPYASLARTELENMKG